MHVALIDVRHLRARAVHVLQRRLLLLSRHGVHAGLLLERQLLRLQFERRVALAGSMRSTLHDVPRHVDDLTVGGLGGVAVFRRRKYDLILE